MIRLLVAYDGTNFGGFQVQPGRRTVQGALEEALAQMTQHPVRIKGAGRTDAGVHALGQVVAFDDDRVLEPEVVLRAMPSLLPPDVAVVDAQSTEGGFNPRAARARTYVYLLWRHQAPHPLYRRYSLWTRETVDVGRLNEALRQVVGTYDFTSFARVREEQTPVRTIFSADAVCDSPFVRITVRGESFLHQMVRSIVGTAIDIGTGRRPVSYIRGALEARDRSAAGPVAPARGLTLVDVEYEGVAWPRRPELSWPWSDRCLPAGMRSYAS